jgi:hypothetical protein
MSHTFSHKLAGKAKRHSREYFRRYWGDLTWRQYMRQFFTADELEKAQPDYSANPSWWIHDFHTVPWRARTRQWIALVRRTHLIDLDALPPAPGWKKPIQYYW